MSYAITSVAGKSGDVVLTQSDITTALGYTPSNQAATYSGFRNRIINGGFDIWQRGTSFSIASGATYTADRWVLTGSGTASPTISQVSLPVQDSTKQFGMYILRADITTAGTAGSTLAQRIEGVRQSSGTTYTVTIRARINTGSTTPMTINLVQHYGTGGSPSADVVTAMGTMTLAASMTNFVFTITAPALTGTMGTNGDDYVGLSIVFNDGPYQMDIAWVQMEVGTAGTDFEQRPIGIELDMCRRYYRNITNELTGTGMVLSGSATSVTGNMALSPPMRVAPTIVNQMATGNFVAGAGPSSAQWGVQQAGIAFASISSGTPTINTASSTTLLEIVIFNQTFNVAPNQLNIGATVLLTLDSEL